MRGLYKILLSIGCLSIGIGIIICIVVVGVGISEKNESVADVSFSEKIEEAESLLIDVSYGNVRIKEGDDFSIAVNDGARQGIESSSHDGTWVIRANDPGSESISFFGRKIRLNSGLFWYAHKKIPQISITIPKDHIFEEVNIVMDSGGLNADYIKCRDLSVEVGAGDIQIGNLEVLRKSEYLVGAGQLVVDEIRAGDVYMQCGAGYIGVCGTIAGDGVFDCDFGAIDARLYGNPRDYDVTADGGIGYIGIGRDEFWGINPNETQNNHEALYDFDVTCSIGSVNFDFVQ